jgi:hypothetical protein
VHTLVSGPRISIVQILGADAGSFTLIESGEQAWVVSALSEAVDAPLRARTVSRAEITNLLRGR